MQICATLLSSLAVFPWQTPSTLARRTGQPFWRFAINMPNPLLTVGKATICGTNSYDFILLALETNFFFRQFYLFDPNPIQQGLLHYSLLRNSKAFKDLEAHANLPRFKTKYKEKLNGVIENLGLQEFEEFTEELNENTSFTEFSRNFYRQIMLENCGISDLENLAKNRQKLLELQSSREICDPVNLGRNYFIFSEILNVDLDTNLSSLAHLTHTSRYNKTLSSR